MLTGFDEPFRDPSPVRLVAADPVNEQVHRTGSEVLRVGDAPVMQDGECCVACWLGAGHLAGTLGFWGLGVRDRGRGGELRGCHRSSYVEVTPP